MERYERGVTDFLNVLDAQRQEYLLEDQNADEAVRILFFTGAAIMAAVALYALWKPSDVFDNVRIETVSGGHPMQDLKRLLQLSHIG